MDLTIDIGSLCNNRCIFCSRDFRSSKTSSSSMSTPELKSRLKTAKALGHEFLTITGGEFTFRDDVFDVLDCVLGLKLTNILIQTNARRFSDKNFTQEFVSYGIRNLLISIHGSKEYIHDKNTGVKGSFKETIQGLVNLVELGIKPSTLMVLTRYNYKDVFNVLELTQKLNLKAPVLSFPMPCKSTRMNFEKIVPYYSEVSPYVNEFFKRTIFKTYTNIHCFPLCFIKGYESLLHNIYYPENYFIHVPKKDKEKEVIKYNNRDYIKPDACNKCDYYVFCEGISKYYYLSRGSKEIKPVQINIDQGRGIKVKTPLKTSDITIMNNVKFTGRSFGGFLIKTKYPYNLKVLTLKGRYLITYILKQSSVFDIEKHFGISAGEFLTDLKKSGFIKFSKNKKTKRRIKRYGDITIRQADIKKALKEKKYEYSLSPSKLMTMKEEKA